MRCCFAAAWSTWQGVIDLELPEGSTVADALAAARTGLRVRAPSVLHEPAWQDGVTGIFGDPCSRDRVLQAGDRVELYRPLEVDPKEARRARAAAAQATSHRGRGERKALRGPVA